MNLVEWKKGAPAMANHSFVNVSVVVKAIGVPSDDTNHGIIKQVSYFVCLKNQLPALYLCVLTRLYL